MTRHVTNGQGGVLCLCEQGHCDDVPEVALDVTTVAALAVRAAREANRIENDPDRGPALALTWLQRAAWLSRICAATVAGEKL